MKKQCCFWSERVRLCAGFSYKVHRNLEFCYLEGRTFSNQFCQTVLTNPSHSGFTNLVWKVFIILQGRKSRTGPANAGSIVKQDERQGKSSETLPPEMRWIGQHHDHLTRPYTLTRTNQEHSLPRGIAGYKSCVRRYIMAMTLWKKLNHFETWGQSISNDWTNLDSWCYSCAPKENPFP